MDVVWREIQALGFQPVPLVDMEFRFLTPNSSNNHHYGIWKDEGVRARIINALNQLESFAQYFENDLADEQIAFTPAGLTFCQNCEFFSIYIGVFRQENKFKLYQNLTKLYARWKPRVERTVLEEQGKNIETMKNSLPPENPKRPMGT